jgi:hypothetical protein
MPYFHIQDFSQGLDTRKTPGNLPVGSLRYANNVHITRGGEVQKRKAFVPYATLPAGSVGLTSNRDNLVVFGNGVQTPGNNILWVNVNGLPDTMMDAARWSIGLFATIAMKDGTRRMMLNGVEVPTWNFQKAGGTPATKPGPVCTYRAKMYGCEGENLYGSKLNDPNVWDPVATGSFVIDTSMQSETMAKLNAMSVFQGSLVLFSEDGIQVWEVDPDPNKNVLARSLTNTGCLSPKTVLNFGNFDVVFLAKSGIRSLKARQANDIMNVQDIGTPIDDFVSELIATVTVDVLRYNAFSIVEPESARLWMALGDIIMVHSYYEGSSVSAWTTYTPGFKVEGMTTLGSSTYLRSGNTIYVYGGTNRVTYDNCKAEVWTPFHHAEKPATKKIWTGFDIGCKGQWTVKVGTELTQPDLVETVGTVTNTTFDQPNETMSNWGTHLSIVMESTDAQAALVSNIAMHYSEGVSA